MRLELIGPIEINYFVIAPMLIDLMDEHRINVTGQKLIVL